MKSISAMARPNKASAAQDRAAGGSQRRIMRTRAGDVVTVSMVIRKAGMAMRVTLRFRMGGVMVTRPVGVFKVSEPDEALKLAWDQVRQQNLAEANGWSWVHP
jgi:hypothetical protein